MKSTSTFLSLAALALALTAFAGCGNSTGAERFAGTPLPPAIVARSPGSYGTPSPPPKHLYVDHNGLLSIYHLPLSKSSKPLNTLVEDPGSSFAPQIAVDPYGRVAIATPQEVRVFTPPIVSFDPGKARLILPLTPAITQIGPSGADLVDMEYDPNGNLWLVSGLGGAISELNHPLNRFSVPSVVIPFGAPGTKSNGYGPLQVRFDVSAALYIYGSAATSATLFKTGFPYTKPPSSIGLDVAQADFVDSSQYLPTDPNPQSVILGQYTGALASPPPQQPPPPPVTVLAQFSLPLDPVAGLFPWAIVKRVVGAVQADPPEDLFFTLDAATGSLSTYTLPLPQGSHALLTLRCLDGVAHCNSKPEHLFLAP
jgi:hypothetical protein